ncbi:MAG: AMP-binding protein [Immundisolibacter sp.]
MPLSLAPAKDLVGLVRQLAAFGERTALRWFADGGERVLDFGELAARVEQAAHQLAGAGLQPGGRVLLLAHSNLPWVVAALGVLRAGGVLVPLDMHAGDEQVHHVLADARPVLVLVDADQAPRLGGGDPPLRLIEALTDGPGEARLPDAVDPATAAVMFYTSGTTGPAKGVPLSHANLLYQLCTVAGLDLARPGDRVLLPLPMHHVYPFVIGLLLPLAAGLTVLLPGAATGPAIMAALREGHASVLIGVPRLYRALLEGIEARLGALPPVRRSLLRVLRALAGRAARLQPALARALLAPLHRQLAPDLRLLACGGAALEPDLDAALGALGWQVAVGYGLTETSPLLTLRPPGRGRPGSAGWPVPGTELRLGSVPAGEDDLPPGSGLIEVRGPGVFAGYFGLPQADREAFTPDGWFRTGDLGVLADDGSVQVLGRASTLIVTDSGKNIQPEELEAIYQAHPLIAEAAVLQVDRRLVALLVPQGETDPGTLRAAVATQSRQLPSYQRVTEFAVTGQPLERTALGKLRRHLLPARYAAARAGAEAGGAPPLSSDDRALLADPRVQAVWAYLQQRYAGRFLTPDSHVQLDLGVDSLGWLDLGLQIAARSGAQLSEDAIGRIETVRDLLQEVRQAETAPPAGLLEDPLSALDAAQRRWLRPPPRWLWPARALLLALDGLVLRGVFRLTVSGRDRLPAGGPFLLAPNHASYLDAPALAAALGRRALGPLCWAGWTGIMLKGPLMRALSRLARVLPMDPERRALSSLAFGLAALRAGNALVWFPEGRRSPSGALEPFQPGIGLLLEHTDVPVVPVFIEGTHQAWPSHRRWPRPRRVRVHFGVPIPANELLTAGADGPVHERAARALRAQLLRLIRSCEGGPPAP